VLGRVDLGAIGLAVSDVLAKRFGSRREEGTAQCSSEAARILGVTSMRAWTKGERLAWERWGPLIVTLPGLTRWSARQRTDLVEIIRAKGGPSERRFVERINQHSRLNEVLIALASPRKISRKSER